MSTKKFFYVLLGLVALLTAFAVGSAFAQGSNDGAPIAVWGDISHLIGIAKDPANGNLCYLTDVGAISCVDEDTGSVTFPEAASTATPGRRGGGGITRLATATPLATSVVETPPAATQPVQPTPTVHVEPTSTARPQPTATIEPTEETGHIFHHYISEGNDKRRCVQKTFKNKGPDENSDWSPGPCP